MPALKKDPSPGGPTTDGSTIYTDQWNAIVDRVGGETNLTASRALVTDASGNIDESTVTSTELGYISGVTSAIQTQLNGKASSSHTHALDDLSDVVITTPASGQYVRHNGTNFVNSAIQAGDLPSHNHNASDINAGTLADARLSTNVVLENQANTYTAGSKQTIEHSSSNAGLNIKPAAGDPSTPADGDVWYNSTTGKFRKRENGVTSDLDTGGGTDTQRWFDQSWYSATANGLRYIPLVRGSTHATETDASITRDIAYTVKRFRARIETMTKTANPTIAYRDDATDVSSLTITGTGEFDSGAISVGVAAGSLVNFKVDTSVSTSGTLGIAVMEVRCES